MNIAGGIFGIGFGTFILLRRKWFAEGYARQNRGLARMVPWLPGKFWLSEDALRALVAVLGVGMILLGALFLISPSN